jgi:phosphoribosylformimino-5-aminoimidazole carboxamide ribonucleotide (ProFAR) isomerase
MIRAKSLHLKDKQFFELSSDGIMRFIGKPTDVAKKLKDEGYDMIHILDVDALKGLKTNFDVYNHLTFTINIEVDCGDREDLITHLLTVKSRVIITLPTKLDLKKYKETKLMVGKIAATFDGDSSAVNDLIVENADDAAVAKFSKSNRVLVYAADFEKLNEKSKKKIFCVIE